MCNLWYSFIYIQYLSEVQFETVYSFSILIVSVKVSASEVEVFSLIEKDKRTKQRCA